MWDAPGRNETMALYTTFVERADRPNLLMHPIVYAVVDDTNDTIIAYCLDSQRAEYIKACLEYAGEHFPEFVRHVSQHASDQKGGAK